MKKRLYKYIGAIFVFCLILFGVCKVVDMHIDNTKIRDNWYYIYVQYASGFNQLVWDVNYGIEQEGTNVQLWTENHGTSQRFYFCNEGEDVYSIRYGEGQMCLGVAADGNNVEVQQYRESKNQLWEIKRVGHTQYFTIQNLDNGLYAEYVKSDSTKFFNISVQEFIDGDVTFYFQLVK